MKTLFYLWDMNETNTHTPDMSIKLTNQSEAVAQAILDIMDMEGGMGASLKEICKETGLTSKVVRGNLGDLVQKGIVEVDPKNVSGAAYDMYYHNDYVA